MMAWAEMGRLVLHWYGRYSCRWSTREPADGSGGGRWCVRPAWHSSPDSQPSFLRSKLLLRDHSEGSSISASCCGPCFGRGVNWLPSEGHLCPSLPSTLLPSSLVAVYLPRPSASDTDCPTQRFLLISPRRRAISPSCGCGSRCRCLGRPAGRGGATSPFSR